jgi:general nucleoside transport system permease protein
LTTLVTHDATFTGKLLEVNRLERVGKSNHLPALKARKDRRLNAVNAGNPQATAALHFAFRGLDVRPRSILAQLWLSYLIYGPWRDPQGFNFPQSMPLVADALYPILVPGTRLNAGVLVVLVAVVAAWVLLRRSFVGFQLRVTGLAEPAARYAGFSVKHAIWLGMLAGGAAAGLAGVGEVAGPLGQLFPTASPGYGYAAIIVAFLGRLSPIGILFSGLFMSLLYLSGEAAQIELNLPSATTGLFQGALLFLLLAADILVNYRIVVLPARALQERSP